MKNKKISNVEMHIDDLADFMFLKNKNDAIIDLSLGGIENNKDMFFFCLDLFCKGLVTLYGVDGKVDVEELKMEAFQVVYHKMSLAGINVKLDIQNIDDPPDLIDNNNSINLENINDDTNDKNLKDYVFTMHMDTILYNVSFELIHKTL